MTIILLAVAVIAAASVVAVVSEVIRDGHRRTPVRRYEPAFRPLDR